MNYNKMKKEELIKTLKERDAVIAGFEETNATLVKEKNDLIVKIGGLTQDCEGMTEECNNLRNKIEELKASLSAKHKQNDALEARLEASEANVITLKKQNDNFNDDCLKLTEQLSIEKSIALDKKRLYTGIIVLLLIGVVVLAIL